MKLIPSEIEIQYHQSRETYSTIEEYDGSTLFRRSNQWTLYDSSEFHDPNYSNKESRSDCNSLPQEPLLLVLHYTLRDCHCAVIFLCGVIRTVI